MTEAPLKFPESANALSPAFLIAYYIDAAQRGHGSLQTDWDIWNIWGSAAELERLCEINDVTWALGLDGIWVGPPPLGPSAHERIHGSR